MAARELSLFADLDQGKLVAGFLSTLQAALPRFPFGDSIPVSFRPLKSNGNPVNPWSEVGLTGKMVRIAIGNPAGTASAGSFTLSYDGDTTAAIAYNAEGAAIQTALNALASITSAGGVTVTRSAAGVIRITFVTAGARTAITADAASIYPSAGIDIYVSVDGDGSSREVVVARVETLPAAYAELEDDFPVAACDIVEARTGSGSVGAILSMSFSVLPYSGFYTLEIDGDQTLGIPWDADASTLQAALELISSVGSGKVEVSGEWPAFTLNFDVSLGDIGDIEIDMSGLIVPSGRVGVLNTNTAAMIELLNGASQATAKLEIELYDIGDGTTWTVLQTDCVVIDDVIGNSPAASPPFPSILAAITPGTTAPVNTFAGAASEASITVNIPIIPLESVTVGPVTYSVIATGPAAPNQIILPAAGFGLTDEEAGAEAIKEAINNGVGGSDPNPVMTATRTGSVVDLTAIEVGVDGDSIALSESSLSMSLVAPSGGADPVTATASPPFVRVAGGFLYIQESGVWKKAALSSL